MGTISPPAATMGARMSEVLSPMPPVECLSTFFPGRFEKLRTSPEYSIASVREASSERDMPRNQMAAWLMAVWLRGLSRSDLASLTEAMLYSGEVLNFSNLPGKKVDKHSTGGIGDK